MRPDALRERLEQIARKPVSAAMRRVMVGELLAGMELAPTPQELDALCALANGELALEGRVTIALQLLRRRLHQVRLERARRSWHWRRWVTSKTFTELEQELSAGSPG